MLPTEEGREKLGSFDYAVAQEGCAVAVTVLPLLLQQLAGELKVAPVVVIVGRGSVVPLLVDGNVPVCAWPKPWWLVAEPRRSRKRSPVRASKRTQRAGERESKHMGINFKLGNVERDKGSEFIRNS